MTDDPMSCEKCGQPHVRCTGHVKTGPRQGQPCMQPPMKGQRVCRKHGGKAPQNLAAAERRVAEAEAVEAVGRFGLEVEISPEIALLQEVNRTARMVRYYEQRLNQVGDKELVLGVTEQKIDPDGGKTSTIKAVPNVWLVLYNQERKHLTEVCAAALRAGIEDKQLELAKSTADEFLTALERVCNALMLTSEQRELLPVVVPRELRAIGGGAAA